MQGTFFLSGQSLTSRSHTCSTKSLEAQAASVSRRVEPFTVESRVVIRFQRLGRKKLPFFRIVAIDSKTRREGVPLEVDPLPILVPSQAQDIILAEKVRGVQRLGWFNPLSKETNLNAPAIKKWLELGATPTEAAARIFRRAMVIDPDISKTPMT